MNYNELIKNIQNKVKNGEPIHGYEREMLIDYQLDHQED